MSEKRVEAAFQSACDLGEGPVWDSHNQQILWLDITQSKIHTYSPESGQHSIIDTGHMVGSIALTESGDILAALQNGFHLLNSSNGKSTFLSDPEADIPTNRFNDGKCDPAGRFWAGTMPLSGDARGNLYVLNNNFQVSTKISDTQISNGLAWSPDKRTFYFIDTPTGQVAAYDYDIETGNIENKRIVITIPESDGYPDGMTIDTDGMLWIALWDGWKVGRWNPNTGELLENISMPVSRPTSCCFGGRNMDELYITSARHALSAEELEAQPMAGSLFVIKNIGYKGMDFYRFKSTY